MNDYTETREGEIRVFTQPEGDKLSHTDVSIFYDELCNYLKENRTEPSERPDKLIGSNYLNVSVPERGNLEVAAPIESDLQVHLGLYYFDLERESVHDLIISATSSVVYDVREMLDEVWPEEEFQESKCDPESEIEKWWEVLGRPLRELPEDERDIHRLA